MHIIKFAVCSFGSQDFCCCSFQSVFWICNYITLPHHYTKGSWPLFLHYFTFSYSSSTSPTQFLSFSYTLGWARLSLLFKTLYSLIQLLYIDTTDSWIILYYSFFWVFILMYYLEIRQQQCVNLMNMYPNWNKVMVFLNKGLWKYVLWWNDHLSVHYKSQKEKPMTRL